MQFNKLRSHLQEKTLSPGEKKKREEVAKAIERDQPGMPMAKKMAIATATAKKVAEERSYTGKGNHRPGWMLKADPELAKKFKEKEETHKARVKAYGNPAAGKSVKEEIVDESKSTASKPYHRIVGTISPELKKRLAAADEKRRENARQLMQRPTKITSEESQKEEVESVAEGSDHDDDYSTASFEKWKKQKEYEKEYDKKKPAKPIVPDNKDKKQGVAEEELSEISKELADRVSTARRRQADASSAKDPYLKPSAETIAKKKKADQAHSSWIKRMQQSHFKGKTSAEINKGYASAADQDYKRGWSTEEVDYDNEQIDELKRSTIGNYMDKTVDPVHGIPKPTQKLKQRLAGMSRAHQRIIGKKPTSN